MKSVYEAATGLEAHMILNLLQQEGIDAQVEGEYLQGGVGELQAMDIVRVVVPEQYFDQAIKIIEQWQANQPDPIDYKKANTAPSSLVIFLVGFIIGMGLMYLACNK